MKKLKVMEHFSLEGVVRHSCDSDDFPNSDWTAPYETVGRGIRSKGEIKVSAKPGANEAYAWGHKTLQFIRSKRCECVTHWEPTSPLRGDRVGINARNFEPEQLGPVRIRRLDGSNTETYLD